MNSLVLFLVGILATWRLTVLLVYEAGPFDVFAHLRTAAGIRFNEFSQPVARNVVAQALLCHRCTSVWVGGLIAVLSARELSAQVMVYALALSAGSVIIQTFIPRE